MSGNIYCLYRHTSPSGKAYIGITCDYTRRCESHQRADGSSPKFHRAIRKYGWDNFTHEILACDLTEEEAQELEVACIAKWNTINEGYNCMPGGGGTPRIALSGICLTDDHINKIAASCANRKQSLETKIKAYMKRHNKSYDEAARYFRNKETTSTTHKDYCGYASVKKTRMKKRGERLAALGLLP